MQTPSALQTRIADIRRRYEGAVKPALDKRDYPSAYRAVLSIRTQIDSDPLRPQIRTYQFGSNFLLTLLLLETGLESIATNRGGDISNSLQRFLYCFSQFETSVETGRMR